MIRALALAAFFSMCALAHAETGDVTSDGWKEISSDDGILVWAKDVEGSDVVAFRGEAVIDAPIAKVAQVLSDTSRKLEWVADCKAAKDIEMISPLDRIEYSHIGTPWPLTDREFVFRVKVEGDRAAKRMVIRFSSIDDDRVPMPKNRVRGRLIQSIYTLTSLEDGNKARLRIEIHADPAGAVPKWLVNAFQRRWPHVTLTNIRKQAAKRDVPEHQFLKAYFGGTVSDEVVHAWVNGGWKQAEATGQDFLSFSMSSAGRAVPASASKK